MTPRQRADAYIDDRGPQLEHMPTDELRKHKFTLTEQLLFAVAELRAIRAILKRRKT